MYSLMKGHFKYFLFIFISIVTYFPTLATHLVGADMTYECVGGGEYNVILNVYRDCGPNNTSGTGFDPSNSIRIYDDITGSFFLATSIFDGVVSDVESSNLDPCLIIPEELCIEKGSYYFNVIVPDTNRSYTLNYQRCCFGSNVNNISSSELTGINISAQIPKYNFSNCFSSPLFNEDPLLAMCVLNPLVEDLGATSSPGMPGVLEHSFFTPYTGASALQPVSYVDLPFVNMMWASGYSATYPIESNPALALGVLTGELTGYVNELGYYIMGTKIDIKNTSNVSVGFIERVFKYTVADCSVGEHVVEIESTLGANIQICNGDLYTFEVGTNATTDSVLWTINGVPASTNHTFEHSFGQDGDYDVVLHGLADSVECYDHGSFSQTVTVFSLEPGFKGRTLVCAGEVDKFNDTTFLSSSILYEITDWLWNFGDGQTSTSQNPEHIYSAPGFYDVTLTVVMNNGCTETIIKEDYVEVYDVDLSFEVDQEICVNNEVQFNSSVLMPLNVTNPVVTYEWSFGDGGTSDVANPIYVYDKIGVYDISLFVELQSGCTYEIDLPNYITVLDDYIDVDAYVVSNVLVYPFSEPLQINSTTNNFDSVEWVLDNNIISKSPYLNYLIGEDYNKEELVVDVDYFDGGCSIHKTFYIPVSYYGNLFIPNAFTPNSDNLNDGFKPTGRVVDHAEYYKFSIYNRYGQEYFTTTDKTEPWIGLNKDDVEVEQGIYVWTLEILTKHSGSYSKNGVVVLIK